MALFSITYDLVESKDYDSLIDRLNELDTVKVQLSQWFLAADDTATEIKDHLAACMDDDDKLMVVEFSKRPQFTRAFKGTNDWLKKHFG